MLRLLRPRRPGNGIEEEVLPHLDSLYGYALYLTRNRNEAEDLTQESMLKAVAAFSQYRPGTNCRAWLFRILHNTWLNKLRKRHVELELTDAATADLEEREDTRAFVRSNPSPEESLVSHMARSRVREAVDSLPPEFRAVVVLADLEEFAYREIADILSIPIGTVMSRLHRGRRLLRIRLMDMARELGLVAGQTAAEAADAKEEIDNVAFLSARRRKAAEPESSEELP
ncbi:MAG: sigma-70 family RNA polymerase sigma factor [Deltaproteobacteria bacterium]|nr:sigma-70 family RNA polymerase sigma factor [Deltaproteobacteria bacterium]